MKKIIYTLKNCIVIPYQLGIYFPFIGYTVLLTSLFCFFSCILAFGGKILLSTYIIISTLCFLYNLLLSVVAGLVHRIYIRTFEYKYFFLKQAVICFGISLECFLFGMIYIYNTPYQEFEIIIAIVHLAIAIFIVSIYTVKFVMDKNNVCRYCNKNKHINFVDHFEISKNEMHMKFSDSLLAPSLVYFVASAYYMKAHDLEFGFVFMVTFFTLFGSASAVAAIKALYKLLFILPEAKKITGSEIYADPHEILKNNSALEKEFFASKQKVQQQ